ncbi:MAG TPA: peptide chain release factor N(5)-glutamine methyltransferase [Acidimicrobiia bacterium]|nr:peptide chain release factor N(5)-glutamine methyltransferase [Acidimicrobiia bacterium]
MPSWRDLRVDAERSLAGAGIENASSEARWMVEHVSGFDAAELVTAEDEPATMRAAAQLDELIHRRTGGEPLQYVLGCWLFRGLELLVDPRVLIPRPETEVTAQVAIDEAVRLGARRGRPDPWAGATTTYAVADLGTGAGALALALAGELPDAEVWGTDVSEDALAVARANVAGTGLPSTRVRLAAGSWFDALPRALRGRLRLVVSNPPYVAESEVADLPVELQHEPRPALVSGPTGMEAIDELAREAPAWLDVTGTFVCEIAPQRAEAAAKVATAAGFEEVFVRRDLAGRDRVLVARMLG